MPVISGGRCRFGQLDGFYGVRAAESPIVAGASSREDGEMDGSRNDDDDEEEGKKEHQE